MSTRDLFMPFGKFKGTSLSLIPTKDLDHILRLNTLASSTRDAVLGHLRTRDDWKNPALKDESCAGRKKEHGTQNVESKTRKRNVVGTQTVIVHHNDPDGRCAAAIVIKSLPTPLDQITCIETGYKDIQDLAWRDHLLGASLLADNVWVVDLSLPAELMRILRNKVKHVTWIDHHQTASSLPYQDLPGIRDFTPKGPAASELAWKYCILNEPMPRIVTLVGDYDSWRLEHPESSAVRVALEAKDWARDPKSDGWWALLRYDSLVASLVANGHTMMEFRDGHCALMAKHYGFETHFEGLRCYVMNVYGLGSQAFGAKMQEYDACLAFIFDGKLHTVGLYSEREGVDCGAICKKHAGGGHKGAAGFQCEHLPFARAPQPAEG